MTKNRRGIMELVTFPRSGILPMHDKFQMTTEDIRFTEGKDGAIHAFVMTVPKPGEELLIKSLGTDAKLLDKPIGDVSLLGSPDRIGWQQEAGGLRVRCPESMPFESAVVFRITVR
jgi:alpha-L-fucosidase